MAVHDWTRVFAGTFHHFHTAWVTHLAESLNQGLLPSNYYALAEQHAGRVNPDVLTLTSERGQRVDSESEGEFAPQGTLAVAEAPPQVSIHMSADEDLTYRMARRTLTIRHRSGNRLVAMIEIVSPGNKDSQPALEQFVNKAAASLQHGIHWLVVDLFPPRTWDPQGIHGAIWHVVGTGGFVLPDDKPLTLAAYVADRLPEAFVEPIAVGQALPDMPVFLTVERYVPVPLDSTYATAFQGLPSYVQDILEGRAAPESGEDEA